VLRQTRRPARILVVDNGSSDDSRAVCETLGAEVIPLDRNLGFAAAVNRGVDRVDEPVVAVLNNDVELSGDWIERAAEAMHETNSWFAVGKTFRLQEENTLDATFDLLCRGGAAWRAGSGFPDSPVLSRRESISFAPFTAVLVKREAFSRLGGLDEDFESYLEDVEFCLRCARQGMRGVYEPAATARHWGSATLGVWHSASTRLLARNQLLLIAKHYPMGWWRRYGRAVLVAQLLWGGVALRRHALGPYLLGKWEGVRDFRVQSRKSAWRNPVGKEVALDQVLRASETRLRELQLALGSNLYWKLYFALTGKGWP
jgi:GT2 family glycosyltransferase